ncbi:MAG: ATP-dependent zinc protease [Gammaproteobacteria bacterium]|nr:ATP-dependent zinc protease [Gammaproteobacteria bacterium]
MKMLGWREWTTLPALGVPALRVKIDTGARTSALNARSIEPFDRDGRRWVRFTLRPDRRRADEVVCKAAVKDVRVVKDSGGHAEERYVIETPIRLGNGCEEWPIEITLANREGMLFAMLIGRTAIEGRCIVNPARSYLAGRPASARPGAPA